MTITLTKAAPEVRSDLKGYYLNSLRNNYEVQSEQRKAELARAWDKAVRDENLRKLRTINERKSILQTLQDFIAGFGLVGRLEHQASRSEFAYSTAA
jgi:hypothetical protein